jgi:wyosine [tRNA(Phe)-imidazoG37] synthetase (radical SAM superfamily)
VVIPFGPVPSRRLGRSLGVNNIPPKACSYACVYCQVGPTVTHEVRRRAFYGAERVVAEVREHLDRAGGPTAADALTFVPDGEPTLDIDLGRAIEGVKQLGAPVAVITNGSLLGLADVRQDLQHADTVSVKVDAVDESVWHRINRPHPTLGLDQVIEGIRAFAAMYAGRLWTETMLVAGLNDDVSHVDSVATFLCSVHPDTAWLSVPLRPPTVRGVRPSAPAVLRRVKAQFAAAGLEVEMLAELEDGAFVSTGEVTSDLLAILAVHPMPEDVARDFVSHAGGGVDSIDALIAEGKVVRCEHEGRSFIARWGPRTRGRAWTPWSPS